MGAFIPPHSSIIRVLAVGQSTLKGMSTCENGWPAGVEALRFHRYGGFFRLRNHYGLFLWGKLLPVATFLDAGVDSADLRFLFHDERSPALRAWLSDRHIRRGETAIGIARAAVEDAETSAAAFAHAAALHEFAFVALRAFDAHGDRARIFALWVAGAANELTEAAVLFHQAVAVERTLLIERFIRLVRNTCAGDKAARGFAIGIASTSEKRAKPATLQGHFLAAVLAIFDLVFGVFRNLL